MFLKLVLDNWTMGFGYVVQLSKMSNCQPYNKDEVVNFRQNKTLSIIRCNHIKFLNSSSRRLKPCDIPLSRKLDYIGIIQPELVFPYAGIREQLAIIFCRKGFKNSLRHW